MAKTFDVKKLNAWVKQIGTLVNLISVSGEIAQLNAQWFTNPWGDDTNHNINGIPYRPSELLTFIDHILSPAADSLPEAATAKSPCGTALRWYPIRNGTEDSGVFIVLSDPIADYSKTPGYIGVGLCGTKKLPEGYSATLTLYLPLYSADASNGGKVVFCSGDAPAQALLSLSNNEKFSYDGTPFSTIQIQGTVGFNNGIQPTLSAAFLDDTGNAVCDFTSLDDFLSSSAVAVINQALEEDSVNTWLNEPVSSNSPSPGNVLQAMGLIEKSESGSIYQVADLREESSGKTVLEIAGDMVFEALDSLAANDTPLFPISTGGIYVVSSVQEDGFTDYGLRLVLPDIALGKVPDKNGEGQPSSGANATAPQLTLQIGAWLTGETGYSDSWLARSANPNNPAPNPAPEPGVNLYCLRRDSNKDISFYLRVELISVGFDYIGTAAKPLVNVSGFILQGIELRAEASVSYDPTQQDAKLTWGLGGAVLLDNIGIPMGTDFNASASEGDNPVVATSVSSGSGKGGKAGTGKSDAVNPPFSASVSYLVNGQLGVQLYDQNQSPTDVVWFKVQSSFGPLFCTQLGVGWEQSTDMLSLIADGGVSTAGLSLDLINLSVGVPVTTPTDIGSYQLGLDGINVSFKEGPISVSAGLLENNIYSPPDYEGQALIQAWRLSISALGSYSALKAQNTGDTSTSLFIFAMLDFPLGGIPAFFINGLSCGFGYNRDLIYPSVNQVSTFPLVAGINNPELLGSTPNSALEALGDWVPPSRGDYWLAAGMKWTTYDVINTNALVTVEFGNNFELGIIGLSLVSLPQGTNEKFAYAELGLELVLAIDSDEFVAAAALSPNSFIIDKNFKLSGGFALDAWWGDNPHSGDFVATLGGYSAAYQAPDYYPVLDRLGFSVQFGPLLNMDGHVYFALTTSNIMTGGEFNVSANYRSFYMWFSGEADLILFWQPFYFDASMRVSAGASYTIKMFGVSCTMKLEAGGTFDLWSPETGGEIAIDFWFFHVPFTFGAKQESDATLPVDWDEFKSLLPPAKNMSAAVPADSGTIEMELIAQPGATVLAATTETESAPDPASDLSLVQLTVTSGLMNYVEGTGGADAPQAWKVRPALFGFATSSVIPSKTLSVVSADGSTVKTIGGPGSGYATQFGIFPMAATINAADHQIRITSIDPASGETFSAEDWSVKPRTMAMPEALWSVSADGSKPPLEPGLIQEPPLEPGLIQDCLCGVVDMRYGRHADLTGPPAFNITQVFAYNIVAGCDPDETYLPINTSEQPAPSGAPSVDGNTIIAITGINDTGLQDKRRAVFAALAEMGVDAGTNGSLSVMATQPSGALRAAPLSGSIF